MVRVGLDIGTRFIKAAEVSLEGNKQNLSKLHSREIEFPLTGESRIKTLKALLESFKPSVSEVNISLSAPSAIVRFISMPSMNLTDLRNALKFEAEKYIPFNMNEVFLDAVILNADAGEKHQMRVLLAAAKRGAVNAKVNMLKEAGLTASVIDIDSFACFNAFCNASKTLDETKSAAVLNIGYTQTNVVIAGGAQPYFTRDIQIGARDIAREISKNLQVEEKDADRLIFDPKDKADGVAESAKPVLGNLAGELRLSFGYYENQYGRSINEIFLSGGVAKLQGIEVFLEENFGIKPVLWEPFSGFEIGPEVDANLLAAARPQFGVCAGLAIRR